MRQENYLNFTQNNFETPFEKNQKFIEDDISILINKNATNEGSINHVVFITDLSDKSYKTFLQLLEICKASNYVINFLYLNATSQNRSFTEDFKAELNRFTNICSRETCGIIWETSISNVAKGIEEVVEQFGGELIVVACNDGKKLNLHKEYLSDYILLERNLYL